MSRVRVVAAKSINNAAVNKPQKNNRGAYRPESVRSLWYFLT